MSLPTAVTDVLCQISQSVADSLVEKLESTSIVDSPDNPDDSWANTIQHQPSYLQVMAEYWQRQEKREQQLSDSGPIPQPELLDRSAQSHRILELLREWQAEKVQTQLEELPHIWQQDAWFSQLSQQATRQILRSQTAQYRLLILTAPLNISKSCPPTFHEDLTMEFGDAMERFFDRHYPLISNSSTHLPAPVEFYPDYFPQPISKIHVCMTREILDPIPTAILYTNINSSQINIHIAVWTPANPHVIFHPLPAWNWQAAKTALAASGIDPANILKTIGQIAIAIHQVIAGFIADWYYLQVNPLSEPRLFNLETYFPNHSIETSWVQPYITCLRKIQQQQIPSMVKQVSDRVYLEKIKSFHYIRTLTGHSSWVDSLAISQDGKILVSGSYDNTIKLWDLSTGKPLHTLVGHGSTVFSVAISPDRQTVVSGSDDGTIKLWNATNAELIRTLRDSDSPRDSATKIHSIAITQDGQKFVSAGDDRVVKIWRSDGNLLHDLTGHAHKVEVVKISPDDRTIVSGSDDGTIKLWDLQTGKLIRSINGDFTAIYALAISSDGQTIISGHGQKQIKLWHLETGQLIRTLYSNFGAVYALAISPDRQILATADFLGESLGNQIVAIQLWDLATGRVIHTLPEHSHRIFSLCFSPDSKTLVSASEDKTIKIWQCE